MIFMASQTEYLLKLSIYSTICSGADQRKHQSSASLTFVTGTHQGLMNSPHKRPAMFPFDDIPTTCDSSMRRNDMNYKYILMFPEQKK